MKAAPYDAIAERYRDSRQLGYCRYVERYTVVELLGDLRGRTVLDLACGNGDYTRLCKRSGAAAVTGVDISREMIALAEAEERKNPLGCRYVWEDAATFTPPAQVDIVVAVYLLNYARTRDEPLPRLLPGAAAGRPARRIQQQHAAPAASGRLAGQVRIRKDVSGSPQRRRRHPDAVDQS